MPTPEARKQALERRRRRERERRAALRWSAHQRMVDANIAAFKGVRWFPWGALVGGADPSGLRSQHLCHVHRYLIFREGCHGRGAIFQAESIRDPRLRFASGLFLTSQGDPKYHSGPARFREPIRQEMCVAYAAAGFAILSDAKAHLAQLQED